MIQTERLSQEVMYERVKEKKGAFVFKADTLREGDLSLYQENLENHRLELAKQLGLDTTQVTDKYTGSLFRKWKRAEKKGAMGGFEASDDVKTALSGFVVAQKSLHSAEGVLKRYEKERDKLGEWSYFIRNGEWSNEEVGNKYFEKASARKRKDKLTRDLLAFYDLKTSGVQPQSEPIIAEPEAPGEIVETGVWREVPTVFPSPLELEEEHLLAAIEAQRHLQNEQVLVPVQETALAAAPESKIRGLLNRFKNPLSRLKLPEINLFDLKPKTKLGYVKAGLGTFAILGLTAWALNINSCSINPSLPASNENPGLGADKAAQMKKDPKDKRPFYEHKVGMDPKAREQTGITVSANVVDSLGTGIKTPSGVELADLRRPIVISEMAKKLNCPYFDDYAKWNDWDPRVICRIAYEVALNNPGYLRRNRDGSIDIGMPPVNSETIKRITEGRGDILNLQHEIVNDPHLAAALAHAGYLKEGYKAFPDCTNGNVDCGITIKGSVKNGQGG